MKRFLIVDLFVSVARDFVCGDYVVGEIDV